MGDLMTRSLSDLDVEALADASEHLGSVGWDETVNAALREIATIHRRRQAFARLHEMAQAGDFDLLLDKRNYR